MKRYTPVWKDDKGNRVIFPARNTVFETEWEAGVYACDQFMYMVVFGFSISAPPLEFEMDDDGHATIEHVAAKAGRLGECCILSGPAFDRHVNSTESV